MKDIKKKEAAELRMLFQVKVSDIQFIKRQQWTVTYYALALIAAIIGLNEILSPPVWLKFILFVGAVAIVCIGHYLIDDFRRKEDEYRDNLTQTQETFSEKFNMILGPLPKEYPTRSYYVFIVIILRTLMWVSVAVTTYAIYR